MAIQDLDGVLAVAAGSVEAPQWSRQAYERILLAGPAAPIERTLLVALSGSALAGFAVASRLPAETASELESIVVHPSFRRRGIGAALLRCSMNSASCAGASAMRLEVRDSNAGALALYMAAGFQQVGRRRSYYSAPVEDALLLEALLDATPEAPLVS